MSRGDYLRFVLAFAVAYASLRFTLGVVLQEPVAFIVSSIVGCNHRGPDVVCGYDDYRIVPECTGIVSVALLLSFLYVLPLPRRRKALAAVFGSAALLLVNLLRVSALVAFTGSIFSYDLLHVLFWLASPLFVFIYTWWLMK